MRDAHESPLGRRFCPVARCDAIWNLVQQNVRFTCLLNAASDEREPVREATVAKPTVNSP
jgi:hypothetical protein